MGRISDMNDRQWRQAVEAQRHVIEDLEESEGKRKKLLAETRAELKGARARLERILKGEDPDEADTFVDGDKGPELPYPGAIGGADHAGDMDASDSDDTGESEKEDTTKPKSGKGKGKGKGSGPRGVV